MALVIAIEGLPGSGKTTVAGRLAEEFSGRGHKVTILDTDSHPSAAALKRIAARYAPSNPIRILLYWVLRLLQAEELDRYRSGDGIVILDRFGGTTAVWDGCGNQVPDRAIRWFLGHLGPPPGLTLFLQVHRKIAARRTAGRTMGDAAFVERVVRGYAKLAGTERWIRINAEASEEDVFRACCEVIEQRLQSSPRPLVRAQPPSEAPAAM